MVLENGQIISNRYEIVERIGAGGMSLVYRAKDTKLDRFVTFKVLRHEHITDEEFSERFRIEARAVARLSHPNIVNVYDVGSEGDINYIVMEYIDGLTLKELIQKKAPFSNDEILGVAIQITDALIHAHANGIVHRDIKPQNILVTNKGTIKVTDFGIARTVNSNTISVGNNTLGSVHYISPEQARGGFIDAKSDLYSLGIVMYEMATGELPFDGESSVAVALMQINEPLPDITEQNADVSKEVEEIIVRMTDKKPFNRYATDQELSDALKGAMVRAGGSDDALVNAQYTSRLLLGDVFDRKSKKTEVKPLGGQSSTGRASSGDGFYDDDEDAYDKSAERKVMAAAIITAFAVIGLVLFLIWPRLQSEPVEYVLMPNLLGMQFDAAYELMAEHGLVLVRGEETPDDEVAEGAIISQNYEEGTAFERGVTLTGDEQISVAVSTGHETFPVPDVTNEEYTTAAQALLNHSFQYVEEYIYDDDTPKDFVVRQDPEGGVTVPLETAVTIYISRGKEVVEVTVPNIVGRSEDSAKIALRERGLQIGNINTAYSDDYERGIVVTQMTSAGSAVREGHVVDFVVSMGPNPEERPTEAERPPEDPDEPTDAEDPDGATNTEDPDGAANTEDPDGTTIEDPDDAEQPNSGGTSTRAITVPSRDFPEGTDSVNVRVMRRNEDGSWVLVTSQDVDPATLPIQVTVSGTGMQFFSVSINSVEVASGNVNFNE